MSSRDIYYPEDDVWTYTSNDDYQVSRSGRVWGPGRYGKSGLLRPTPNSRTGHLYVTLYKNGKKVKKYVHQLVAEAFIPNPNNYPIVRHLDDDPSNNCVENLAWGTQVDNMRDAIRNDRFRYLTDKDRENAMKKRRTPIKVTNLRTGKEMMFESQQEASRQLNISQGSINKVLSGRGNSAGGCFFAYANSENTLPIENRKFSLHKALIKATNVMTGDEMYFKGQTEAAKALGISVSAVSTILSKKYYQLKGYHFEYANEEDIYD